MNIVFSRKFPFVFREQLRSVVADSGKLSWGSQPTFKPQDLDSYYSYFEENGTIQRSIIDLSETAGGQGFYTTVDKDVKAKELCDEFCQKMNLDVLVPNIMRNMLIAGFLPVETAMNKFPSKCALKLVHPKSVEKIILDEKTAKLDFIEQKASKLGSKNIRLEEKDLAWFNYNQVGNDPRGNSLVKGIIKILGYQENAVANMDKILARYASPLGIWKSKRAIDAIKKVVESVEAGEDIFLGMLTDEEIKDLVQHIQIDPRARFWEFYEYLDRKVYESLGAPSLGYWRNATQASAQTLDDIVQRNIHALQRNVKRVVEAKLFGPLCELNGCSEVPKLEWGFEKTGVEDLNLSDFLVKGLEVGYISMGQYMKLLQSMGLRVEEEKPEGEVSGAAKPEVPEEQPTEEKLREELHTTQYISSGGTKPQTKCPNSEAEHEWILGRLRSQDAVWVCKNGCGAIKVTDVKFAV